MLNPGFVTVTKKVKIDGEYSDPESITITVINPRGVILTDSITPTRDTVGHYHYTYTFPQDGPPGEYTLIWTITFDDGNTIEVPEIVETAQIVRHIVSDKEVEEEYKVLGKDMLVSKVANGNYYDIHLQGGDMVMLTGPDCISNDMKLRLLTVWGEMKGNPTFGLWGNHAAEESRNNNTEIVRESIKQDFRDAILGSSRVYRLDRLDVTFKNSPVMGVDVLFTFTTMNDQVVTGGVSLT